MTNKDIKLPFYSGNIRLSKCLGWVSLEYFITSIQNPRSEIMILFKQIEEVSLKGNKYMKRKLKQKLFSFTPTALIKKGFKRGYVNVFNWNPLLQIDLDGIETKEKAIMLKKYIFNEYPQVVCVFLSPSRLGVKALMRIKRPKSKEHYKAIHKSVTAEFNQLDYFDEATKNAMLPLFLSYDKDIMYRDFSECVEWDKEDWSKPKYEHFVTQPQHFNPSNTDKHMKRVIRITQRRINFIVDNGHPQVRDTAIILGSRVAAGYISESEAKDLIINLVRSNNYLQKELNNYVSTCLWGIRQGMKKPMYFND